MRKIEQGFSEDIFNQCVEEKISLDEFSQRMHASIPLDFLDNTNMLESLGVHDYRGRILENLASSLLMKNKTRYNFKEGNYIQHIRYPGFGHTVHIFHTLNNLIDTYEKETDDTYKKENKTTLLALASSIISTSHPFIDGNGRIARRAIKYISEVIYHEKILLNNMRDDMFIEYYRLFTLYTLPHPENPLSRKQGESYQIDFDTYSKDELLNFSHRYADSLISHIHTIEHNIKNGKYILQDLPYELQQCLQDFSILLDAY